MKKRLKFICTILILTILINILPIQVLAAEVKQKVKTGIESFPESYQKYLKAIKEQHPNWSFEAYYTGIDWNEFIKNETGTTLHTRSVVPSSYSDVWKCSKCQSINSWTCASEAAVAYFADPRNFLDEIRIFQFEELSFNESVHKLDSIKKSVQGTFLRNSVTYYDEKTEENVTKTYSEIILEAAKHTNMSPFHIKSKIIQEVGINGSSSVSGTYSGYEGLYNFFNYGAYDEGDPIANSLEFARKKGWTNPYKAILGGAELIGSSYIGSGQNTSYFFKFDVVGNSILKAGQTANVNTSNFYSHQYMTNIMDPYSQSSSVYNMYAANGNIDANLNFIIPVYDNMPELNTRPTKYTLEDGELYYATATVEAKDTPIKTSKTVYTMSKGEVAVMVSRNHTESDGSKWDIVMLENGWNVYVENHKIQSCVNKEVEKEQQIEKASIDKENLLIKTTPNITNEKLEETIGKVKYNIVDANGETATNIATGYKLNILKNDNKTVDKTYTLVKVGDVNGDSKVTSVDYVLIKNLIMNSKELTKSGNKAADVNEDSKVTAADYVKIKNHIMDSTPINIK